VRLLEVWGVVGFPLESQGIRRVRVEVPRVVVGVLVRPGFERASRHVLLPWALHTHAAPAWPYVCPCICLVTL
jgi:hypothetical protein